MGIWFFLLVINLVIPLSLFFFGWILYKKTPKDINYVFGYRTKRSMTNENTWIFAQRYFGRRSIYLGLLLILMTIVLMLLVIKKDNDVIANTSMVLVVCECIPLFLLIFATEKALKKQFDNFGRKRTG
jgi:uncharacterized membrane protein